MEGRWGKEGRGKLYLPVGWINGFHAELFCALAGDRDPRRREKEGDCTGW